MVKRFGLIGICFFFLILPIFAENAAKLYISDIKYEGSDKKFGKIIPGLVKALY